MDSAIGNNKEEVKHTSFEEAWKTLDNVGSDSDQKDLKKDLLELAKQGKLTVAEFNKTTGAKSWLKEIGIDAEEAVQKINKLVSSADQLASMKTGISSISSALGEKKENLSKKKTANDGISIDTLSSMPEDIKECRKEYERFCEVLGNGSSTMKECEDAANKLAAAYIKNGNFLANLTAKNKDYYISVLKEMGIQNAEEIVLDALSRKKAEAAVETMNFTNKTGEEIVKLLEEQGALNGTAEALKLYALKKIYANGHGLDTTNDINQLIALVKSLGYSTEALDKYNEALNSPFKVSESDQETNDTANDLLYGRKKVPDLIKERNEYVNQQRSNATSYIDGIIAKMEQTKVKTPTISPTGESSKDKGKSTKESKQQIDWLSRMLDTLQNKVDMLKAKFENLFSIGKKKNNLTNQIKKTTKLLNAQEKAASRYQKIADSYYKKNKKKLSKNGITLSMLQNGSYDVKSYKSSIAEIIQTYEDYIDKAQEAKKAAIGTKTAVRELKIQRNQLYIDRADSKLSAIDAQAENQKNAEDTNKYLEKKVKWTKQYYNYQIKNAKLEKDATKEAELQAQKKKALLDIEIQKNQNLADDRESHYSLNQQREENATSAKEKNKYEAESLKNLKDQYKYQKEIAKLEHGEKSAEYKLLQEEEKAKIAESYQKMYDNIKTEYENKTGLNDAQIATVQSEISALEAAGKSVSKAMYEGMMKLTSDKKEKLLEELADLEEAGKNFEYGSDKWYAWQNDLEATKQGLYDCTQQIIEFQKKVNELDFKKFTLMAAQLDATKSHLDFLVDMLSHEDLTSKESGGLTDAGMATVSLKFSNIDNHKKIIENAQNDLKELYAKHADGSDFLTEEEFLAKREEQLDIIRDSTEAIADEKDAILDLVENALELQIDSINELIEKKKKALATEKDYKKELYTNHLVMQFLF